MFLVAGDNVKPKKHSYAYLRKIVLVMGLLLTFYALHFTRVRDEGNGTWGGANTGISITSASAMSKEAQAAISNSLSVSVNKPGGNNISYMIQAFIETFTNPFHFEGLILAHAVIPVCVAWIIVGFWTFLYINRRNLYRQDAPGKENGSATFNNDAKGFAEKYTEPYTEQDKKAGASEKNIILAKDLKLSMNGRRIRRNMNALVTGGSGTGKTYGLIKPNLAQMNSSFVITDPSGEILDATGIMLMENGYTIKLFSISDMAHSNCYNPLDYIYDEDGNADPTKVQVLVSVFIENSNGKKSGGDPFWTKSEAAFMTFAILYLAEFCNEEERNMYNILRLAQCGRTDEDSSSSQTLLDKIVEDARKQNPGAKCFISYDTFKLAPAKTANSILISLAVDLNLFASDRVRNMTSTGYVCTRNEDGSIKEYVRDGNGHVIRDSSNLDLQTIGDTKTALFVNIPQANSAYNFLIAMMYSQLFDQLYFHAEKICPNRWHIFDQNGEVISSQYKTEAEASKVMELYSEAKVITDTSDGFDKYYIYNQDAGKEYTLPEKAINNDTYGYMQEVYSVEVGEKLIKRYQNEPEIQKGQLWLPIHVRLLLDEFANIGRIPDFDKMLATMRKYEISSMIILQSLAQAKEIYDKLWEAMVGNCDTFIFLGSSEMETAKYVSEKLGKATIRVMDESQSKSASGGSISNSFKKQARDLMDAAEVTKLGNNECLVMVRGEDPFRIDKYDWKQHPHYAESGDADPTRKIDLAYLERHFACKPKGKPTTMAAMEVEEDNQNILQHSVLPDVNRSSFSQNRMKQFETLEALASANGCSRDEFTEQVESAQPVDQSTYYGQGELLPSEGENLTKDENLSDPTVVTTGEGDPEDDDSSWVFNMP